MLPSDIQIDEETSPIQNGHATPDSQKSENIFEDCKTANEFIAVMNAYDLSPEEVIAKLVKQGYSEKEALKLIQDIQQQQQVNSTIRDFPNGDANGVNGHDNSVVQRKKSVKRKESVHNPEMMLAQPMGQFSNDCEDHGEFGVITTDAPNGLDGSEGTLQDAAMEIGTNPQAAVEAIQEVANLITNGADVSVEAIQETTENFIENMSIDQKDQMAMALGVSSEDLEAELTKQAVIAHVQSVNKPKSRSTLDTRRNTLKPPSEQMITPEILAQLSKSLGIPEHDLCDTMDIENFVQSLMQQQINEADQNRNISDENIIKLPDEIVQMAKSLGVPASAFAVSSVGQTLSFPEIASPQINSKQHQCHDHCLTEISSNIAKMSKDEIVVLGKQLGIPPDTLHENLSSDPKLAEKLAKALMKSVVANSEGKGRSMQPTAINTTGTDLQKSMSYPETLIQSDNTTLDPDAKQSHITASKMFEQKLANSPMKSHGKKNASTRSPNEKQQESVQSELAAKLAKALAKTTAKPKSPVNPAISNKQESNVNLDNGAENSELAEKLAAAMMKSTAKKKKNHERRNETLRPAVEAEESTELAQKLASAFKRTNEKPKEIVEEAVATTEKADENTELAAKLAAALMKTKAKPKSVELNDSTKPKKSILKANRGGLHISHKKMEEIAMSLGTSTEKLAEILPGILRNDGSPEALIVKGILNKEDLMSLDDSDDEFDDVESKQKSKKRVRIMRPRESLGSLEAAAFLAQPTFGSFSEDTNDSSIFFGADGKVGEDYNLEASTLQEILLGNLTDRKEEMIQLLASKLPNLSTNVLEEVVDNGVTKNINESNSLSSINEGVEGSNKHNTDSMKLSKGRAKKTSGVDQLFNLIKQMPFGAISSKEEASDDSVLELLRGIEEKAKNEEALQQIGTTKQVSPAGIANTQTAVISPEQVADSEYHGVQINYLPARMQKGRKEEKSAQDAKRRMLQLTPGASKLQELHNQAAVIAQMNPQALETLATRLEITSERLTDNLQDLTSKNLPQMLELQNKAAVLAQMNPKELEKLATKLGTSPETLTNNLKELTSKDIPQMLEPENHAAVIEQMNPQELEKLGTKLRISPETLQNNLMELTSKNIPQKLVMQAQMNPQEQENLAARLGISPETLHNNLMELTSKNIPQTLESTDHTLQDKSQKHRRRSSIYTLPADASMTTAHEQGLSQEEWVNFQATAFASQAPQIGALFEVASDILPIPPLVQAKQLIGFTKGPV